MPVLPDNMRVYAVGDVHGRADLLDRMLAAIGEDDSRAPRAAWRVLVTLGDYVDRGPDSRGAIDRLLRGAGGLETVHLIGNHERLMLDFLERPAVGRMWLEMGGAETLASYGADLAGQARGADWLERLRDTLAAALPPEHLAFLRGLKPSYRAGDYLFVHAGVRPGRALERQREDDLLWIRDDFLDDRRDFGAVVVHGHSPAPEPQVRNNRIGIDTGSGRGGGLCCLVLEGAERRFLGVADP